MTDTTQIPEPQRLRALEHANAIRLARAELKRLIAGGEISAADVILQCPEAARRWTISELLLSQRRWGSSRARKFLERNGVSEIKLIGSLTERQRLVLAEQLGARAAVAALREPVALREPATPREPVTRREPAVVGEPAVLRDPAVLLAQVDLPELACA